MQNPKQWRRTSDRNTTNPSHSTITSALLFLNLASNAASYSSLRTKRRSHHAPNNIGTYPPSKRESNISCLTLPSPSASRNISISKMKHASTTFPKILTAPSIEACAEPSALKNKATINEGFNVSTIFSSSSKNSPYLHKSLH